MPNSPNHYRRVRFQRAVPGPGGAVYQIGQEAELHWRTADALAASGDVKILPWPDPPKAEPKSAQAEPKAEPAKPPKAEPAKPAANKPPKAEPKAEPPKAEPSPPAAASEAKAEPKAEPEPAKAEPASE